MSRSIERELAARNLYGHPDGAAKTGPLQYEEDLNYLEQLAAGQ